MSSYICIGIRQQRTKVKFPLQAESGSDLSGGNMASSHLSNIKVWRRHLQDLAGLKQEFVQAGQLLRSHLERGSNVL